MKSILNSISILLTLITMNSHATQSITSINVTQIIGNVSAGATDQPILKIQINTSTSGTGNPIKVQKLGLLKNFLKTNSLHSAIFPYLRRSNLSPQYFVSERFFLLSSPAK